MNSKNKEASTEGDAKGKKNSESGAHQVDTTRKKEGARNPPRRSEFSSDFVKDYTRAKHSGVHNMELVNKAMQLLVENKSPLDAIWEDHELKGEWADHRELHVKGDLLLIYTLGVAPKGFGTVVFERLGSHTELFD